MAFLCDKGEAANVTHGKDYDTFAIVCFLTFFVYLHIIFAL